MVNLLEALFLALIQGLTEWLPVSSSGHLVIFQKLFGIKASVAFDVMLHLGTFFAVLYFLRKEILEICKLGEKSKKLLAYIIVGSLPIAIFGFAFKSFFESLFSSLMNVALALVFNGLILYSTKFFKGKKKLKFSDSLFIGIVQAISLIPGISRSGITISAAILRGIDKKTAYKFSFLLSMVAILGASLLKFNEIDFSQEPLEIILVGTIASAFFGYLALKTVVKFLLSEDFHKFAYYCWFMALLIFLFTF